MAPIKMANVHGYDPFSMPTLPYSLLQAIGLNANQQALPDAHLLAAVGPQMDRFAVRNKPDAATHALVTSLLAESVEDDDNLPELGEEEDDGQKVAQQVPEEVSGFLEELSKVMVQELKKRAGAVLAEPGEGPGTNTGHGHVWVRPDGMRARCMPSRCASCQADELKWGREKVASLSPLVPMATSSATIGDKLSTPRSVGVGMATAQLGQTAGEERRDSVQHALRLAKRRSTYSGKRRPWRPSEEQTTVQTTDQTKTAGLGGLLGRLRNTAGNIGTGVRNIATGVTRPGDSLVPGTAAFDRLIPPVVQQNNALVLPGRPSMTATVPSRLRRHVETSEGISHAGARLGDTTTGIRGIYSPNRLPRGTGTLGVGANSASNEAISAAHESAHALSEAAGAGLPTHPIYRIPGAMGNSRVGAVRGLGDIVGEFMAQTRGEGLLAGLRYLLSGRPEYARQIAQHSPVVGMAYRAGPYAAAAGVGAGLAEAGNAIRNAAPGAEAEPASTQNPQPRLPEGRTKTSKSSILLRLLAAKGSSDQRDYAKKHSIMRELMTQRPDEFEKEEPVRGIQGITHKPTGFRLHLPKEVVPERGV